MTTTAPTESFAVCDYLIGQIKQEIQSNSLDPLGIITRVGKVVVKTKSELTGHSVVITDRWYNRYRITVEELP